MRYCFSRSLAARQSIRRRLGLALLVVLIACGLSWASSAWADAPTSQTRIQYTDTMSGYSADRVALCQWYVSMRNAQYPGTTTYVNATSTGGFNNTGVCTIAIGGTNYNIQFEPAALRCYDGSAPVNGVCGSPPPACSDASMINKYVGASVQGTGTSLPSTICIQGCAYSAGSVGVQVGTSYAVDLGKGTGATCSGANYDTIDTTTKATDAPSLVSCAKQGKVYGTVNGVGICAAAGTIPNSTVSQNGSTTTQNTSASGVQGTPTTSTTTTTVSNVNNVSTVTTTTTNPDGSKSSTTQDQATYCQQNPSAQVCKGSESTASGGTDCTTPPTCSGDAIQCMMVNQQWRTRCDSNQPSSLSDLGSKLVSGQDPVANPASSGNRTVNPIASSIDQSSFLNGAGLSDKVVSVSGQSITLPFSRLNQYLVWLGHLFVVISLIGAIRIVLGGFK
ncbi:conserved exported hypothetical protein [Cupriavidus taiwanensis]|uniref:hypothetical protein n=1 Tax=Cupriavidus taiwanensis TaxID=164546 RepID=UPI000E1247F0|nr:hypothetical protein [Cupriavidus taiwanensis]SOZ97613.1 conserved exported hypothetical protein [Cupriavidus taiwanensis]